MDDLISRQAAIDALCNMHCGCTISDCPLNYEEDGAEECADVRWLMGLPSAQRKGKWIHKPGIYGVVYCSECDFELHINDTPYCPNCGAEMAKGEEDDK